MKRRILWIEDEMYLIGNLADGLREENVEVISATTEKEWKKELNRKAGYFDLVILDIMLPQGSGVLDERQRDWRRKGETLLTGIKDQWPKTPVVVFTILLADDHEDRIKALGADEYLQKPVLVREFEEVIFKWLGIQKKETD